MKRQGGGNCFREGSCRTPDKIAMVLVMLWERTHRFNELARRIGGVSEKMLAHTLRVLEEDGFVLRVVHPSKPPKVEYSLSPLGREAAEPVLALTSWVEANIGRVLLFRNGTAPQGGC